MQTSEPIFLDANILLDFLDDRRPKHTQSKELLERLILAGVQLGISDDILTTVYYVGRKGAPREKLLDFMEFITESMTIHPFSPEVIKEAIAYCRTDTTADFEDTLQAYCATKNDYRLLITHDDNFPEIEELEIIDAETYLSTYLS